MRRIVTFACEGAEMVGTLDPAPGTTGLLIVSGGNEVRCGAHRGMALLAGRLAAAGVPVLRFDRRGVGDSAGDNGGWASSAPDIAAALDAFRAHQPQLRRIVGFGNCDAATALAMHDTGCDRLILANPWLGDEAAAPPPAAQRAAYLRRLASLAGWRQLLSSSPRRLIGGVRSAFGQTPEQPLAARMAAALAGRWATIILAAGDRTAQVFDAAGIVPADARVVRIATGSHSFAGAADPLEQAISHALAD